MDRQSICSEDLIEFFLLLLCVLLTVVFLWILSRLLRQQPKRADLALNAEEFSKAIPFLVRPEKLDGSMAGDMGFDPMRL